ncbi:ABC transporter ATP-binding protein [Bosea caraganae]|uniref:ABC transporter ATP-binding protein n=1 Tax=Bosea caraganae TaxID=2763117 RepID=A0A370KZT2_9HYPH|nr:ABC transporter ATP-binding protein [Bosea caraganae]RDJ20366.1 ABC transporter ATP-binding protein [Bosea caraganae]RDJ26553.1 ABC transporter ATP-binding protein [Bosea caraganae]
MSEALDQKAAPLLEVKDLSVRFVSRSGSTDAVRGVSFDVGRERVAIVGESGSGKSTVGRSILRLHSAKTQVTATALRFAGTDLLGISEKQMRAIRGRRISMIMQDPKYALNPVMTVGEQLAEAFVAHGEIGRREARERSLEMLEAVRIRDPRRVFDQYPHQISGGMGQRVMIAMMLAPEPDLLIADEPTSALDVTVRLQVLAVLDDLVAKRGLALLFISHDLNLVATFCDRILVMFAGRIVESIASSDLANASHPYTRGLLDAVPKLEAPRARLPVLQRDPAWLQSGAQLP